MLPRTTGRIHAGRETALGIAYLNYRKSMIKEKFWRKSEEGTTHERKGKFRT